jgi:ComF family protein
VLTPVPLHPSRLRQRGFNQSLLLAREVGRTQSIPVVEALIRTRRTNSQVRLGAAERAGNVAGALAVLPGQMVTGRSFLLVDDVITTGATLGACASALLDAGASSVSALTVAREM